MAGIKDLHLYIQISSFIKQDILISTFLFLLLWIFFLEMNLVTSCLLGFLFVHLFSVCLFLQKSLTRHCSSKINIQCPGTASFGVTDVCCNCQDHSHLSRLNLTFSLEWVVSELDRGVIDLIRNPPTLSLRGREHAMQGKGPLRWFIFFFTGEADPLYSETEPLVKKVNPMDMHFEF